MIPTIYTRDQIKIYYANHDENIQYDEPDVFTVGYHYENEYSEFGKRILSLQKKIPVIIRHRTLNDGTVLQRCNLRELDVDYSPETDVTQWMEIDVPRSVLVTEDPQEALAQYSQMILSNSVEGVVF